MKNDIHLMLYLPPGGTRGRISLGQLIELENSVQGTPIVKLFDTFSGASIGAGSAASLNIPSKENPNKAMWSTQDILNNYSTTFKKLFDISKTRKTTKIISGLFNDLVLNKTLGLDSKNTVRQYFSDMAFYDARTLDASIQSLDNGSKLKNAINNIIIPAKQIPFGQNIHFTNLENDPNFSKYYELRIADCVSASCRLQGIFPSKTLNIQGEEMHFIDGFTFDHEYLAYLKLKECLPSNTEIYVISIGTGYGLPDYNNNDYNASSLINNLGFYGWEKQHSLCTAYDQILRNEIGDRYIKIDKNLTPLIKQGMPASIAKANCASDINFKYQDDVSKIMFKENKEKYEKIIQAISLRNNQPSP